MGNLLSAAAIAGLFGIGVGALFAPEALAENYGLPIVAGDTSGRGLIRALGARDATLGAVALAFALKGDRAAVRTVLGISTIVAIADFTIVATTRGFSVPSSLAIHGSGIVGLLLAGVVD
jgi:hypothetical protein